MAKRDSHALEIALIVFVVLTAFSWIWVLAAQVRFNRTVADKEATQQELQQTNTSLRTLEGEAQRLKAILGYGPQDPLGTIEQNFTTDVTSYAAGLDEQRRNYREIEKYLYAMVQDKANQILQFEETVQNLQQQVDKARADEAAKVAELQKAAQAARDELASVRNELAQQQQQDDQQKQRLLAQLNEKTQALEQTQREATAKVNQAQNDLALLRRQYDRLKEQLDQIVTPTLEVPDGRITWVDQKTRTVYVNVGRQDGLRRNLVFTVYGRDENNLTTAVKKGQIEITNVHNGHTAEGRILEDENKSPILSGDLIATPIWNPGSTLRFALVGRMDVNNDGRDDRDLIKSMIRQFGGQIDAEDGENGVQGQMSIHTRYLVVGDRPTDASDPQVLRNFSDMMDSAARLNVEQISVYKLIDAMGMGTKLRASAGAARVGSSESSSQDTVPRG